MLSAIIYGRNDSYSYELNLSTALGLNQLARQLEERVNHYLPSVGYDAPGDFQMTCAADLTALCAFDERMMQGWHVDSHMNAHLALKCGALSDLNETAGSDLKLFRAEDPFEEFVYRVTNEIPPDRLTARERQVRCAKSFR